MATKGDGNKRRWQQKGNKILIMNRDDLKQRVENLESALAYLQHDFEAQNETILLQTKQIVKLENSIKKLLSKIETIESGSEKRDPLDEKPPHY